MALKVSNKNRKKVYKQKIEQIEREQEEFTRKFTKPYILAVVIVIAIFLII